MADLTDPIASLGKFLNRQVAHLGAAMRFGLSAMWFGVRGLFSRRIYPRHDLIVQMDYTGARSTLIMVLLGFLVGASLVIQTTPSLARYGPAELVAGVVGVSILRTLGPLLAAIIFAGRVGAGFTAELGTMAVSEEITALDTMGINPVGYLVAPRFLAACIMLPACTVMFDLAALIGGYVVGIYQFNILPEDWFNITKQFVKMSDFTFGLAKSVVFAWLITLVCCYKGYHVRGSGIEVGRATMQAIVICLVLIIVSDTVMSLIYNFLYRMGIVS
ncbi:MAG: ABC transporter permease [Planctomycetes bacterium]|nr:ABC transporter permease [Planctomycetota bacterium]